MPVFLPLLPPFYFIIITEKIKIYVAGNRKVEAAFFFFFQIGLTNKSQT